MPELPGKTEKVRDICRRLKPFMGKKADQVFSAYLAEDENGKEQIDKYLQMLLVQKLSLNTSDTIQSLVPPESSKVTGEYKLGQVIYGGKEMGPFGLREKEWIQHVGIFGRTGSGKTNLGYLALRELHKHKKPFMVFDWKRNYRDLLQLPEFKDVEVYTVGRSIAPFSFNPLIPPPGTSPKTWLKKIIEVIAHAYMLGNGVLYLLQQSVDKVYEEFGVYSGKVTRYPTIRDVLEVAQKHNAKGRESGWLSSTLRALSSLCFGDMDTLINQGENQNLENLLTKPVILELESLAQSDKVFFIQALLLWIHHYRMSQGEREHFRHAVLIEEAHHVLSNERRSLIGGQSVMDITFREIREFGESLIILDQAPSQISLPALGNTYTTICLNLKHSRDVNAMAQCMLMDSSEREILGNLEIGQAAVKLQGRAPKPFMIKIPEFPVKKGLITDQQIRTRMADKIPAMVNHPTQQNIPTTTPESTDTSTPQADTLDIKFLKDVMENPESGIAKRYKRLGISVRQGQKLKTRLAEEYLITETLENTLTGTIRTIKLTENAERMIEKQAE